jgi:hypothetical protein
MVVLFVFALGTAVAACSYFLIRALSGISPAFNRETIAELGYAGSFLTFCCAGPILLIDEADHLFAGTRAVSIRNTVVLTAVMLAWTGSLGVLSIEGVRAIL